MVGYEVEDLGEGVPGRLSRAHTGIRRNQKSQKK